MGECDFYPLEKGKTPNSALQTRAVAHFVCWAYGHERHHEMRDVSSYAIGDNSLQARILNPTPHR